MRKRCLILVLSMLIMLNLNILVSAKTEAKNDFLPKLEGTWINENYISKLKELKSPIKAIKHIGYPAFYIRKDNKRYVFNAVVDFHQGIGWEITDLVKLPEDKMYRFSNNQEAKKIDILVISENQLKINKITLILEKSKIVFVRINNTIDEYVNSIVLAGEYRDNNGKVYKFNNNNFAQWPDRTFKYRLNLDPVFAEFDYFANKEIFYAFEFTGEDLYIYKAKSREYEEGLDKEPKPFLVLKPSIPKLSTVQGNLLTSEYAKYYHQFPGGKKISAKEQQIEISKANSLSEQGFTYYKDKKDTLAIGKYEEALKHFATAEIYYRYGNSLSNIPRLEDAVKAYQIAIELNYDKPYLIYYNIACVYSRMNKSEEAFTNLELAMNSGYKNFDHIQKDGDLVWLRSQPEWKNWLAGHQK